MSASDLQPQTLPYSLCEIYAPVEQELAAVEARLRKELSSGDHFVNRLARHGFRLGGKRLRPALVLLSAQACGGIRPEHITLAAAAELIHTATLIHDDVLDEATVRRHSDTINARWNNEVSILLGDYLFACAMCLAGSLEDNYACQVISRSAREMCEGELRQIESRGNFDIREADYYRIIAGKTAALMACCCRLGAYYAGAEPAFCEGLDRYGHNLGIAFQITDDVLDLTGDEATVGKTLGSDLSKQKATLPLIRLLACVEEGERPQLLELLTEGSNDRRASLQLWLKRYDVIPYVREQAENYTRLASEQLQLLPSSPALQSLHSLARFVIERRQ